MNLFFNELQLKLEFVENKVNLLCVENKKTYCSILDYIWKQVNGEEGPFLLTENEKELKIAKEMTMIFNPFSIDCNERKILTKLYQEMKEIAIENYGDLSMQAVTANINYLDNLFEKLPYGITYNLDVEWSDIYKAFNVHIVDDTENLKEKIVNYIKILGRLCKVRVVVFVGLKQYFENDDLEDIYQELFYEKINVIDIENNWNEKRIDSENVYIVDNDLCIIELV